MQTEATKALLNEKYRAIIERALQYEDEHPASPAWEWYDVRAAGQTLNYLVTTGLIEVVFKSNRSTMYRVVNPEDVKRVLKEEVAAAEKPATTVPEDLFDCIILHDDKKEILRKVLSSPKPTHCLLSGEIASSKTLFMQEVARLPGAYYLLGSSLSRAGMYDLMFEHRPRYLVIDELDKVKDFDNTAALLSLMETGILSEAKYKRRRYGEFDVRVIGGCNDEDKLPPELLSRFGAYRLRFVPYTDSEFLEVAQKVLVLREGTDAELASYIASKVLYTLNSRDVRTARSIARTTDSKADVDRIITLLHRQAL